MNRPVDYLQYDRRWGGIDYSALGEKTTIAKAGCGPTCAAMVVATLKNASITPDKAAKWALENSFKAKHQGTYYSFFRLYLKKFGIECKQVTKSSVYHKPNEPIHKIIIDELRKGNIVIACMGPGYWTSSGHFVLAFAVDLQDRVYINDPNSTKDILRCASLKEWQNQVKHYFVVEVEQKSPDNQKEEKVEVIKKDIIFDENHITVNAVEIEGENYMKVKDLSLMGFNVGHINGTPKINTGRTVLEVNDTPKVFETINTGNKLYIGLRDFAKALNKAVIWDEKRTIIKDE